MGLNLENIFVKTESGSDVARWVQSFLKGDEMGPVSVSGWSAPVTEPFHPPDKRKVAVSVGEANWVTVVASDEIASLSLALHLSASLGTEAVVAQLYEVAGSCGHTLCRNGAIIESVRNEDSEDPLGDVVSVLRRHGIESCLVSFREAVAKRDQGWVLVKKAPGRRISS